MQLYSSGAKKLGAESFQETGSSHVVSECTYKKISSGLVIFFFKLEL